MKAVPGFDVHRAKLSHPRTFPPFLVPDTGVPLAGAKLPKDDLVFIVGLEGQRRALLLKQLAYPHVAQGDLAGHPYLVAF